MELKILVKALRRKEFAIPIAFLLFLLFFGAIMLLVDTTKNVKNIERARISGCVLEYGPWQCIDDKIAVPFYNSGVLDITMVRLRFPVRNGWNVYEASGMLRKGEAGTLLTESCADAIMEGTKVEWCCSSDCFISDLKNPNQNVLVKINSFG
ncbi:MAG: hypothetical protein N3F05_00580 [Candidatus Diapherotrites archaeon]|nr:hypothetical protein [Candidatus Diapherotrites archaeon]